MATRQSREKARKTTTVARRAREVGNASRTRRARRRVKGPSKGFQFAGLINTYSVIAVGVVLAVGLSVGAMALFGPDEAERRRLMNEGASTWKRLQKRLPSLADLSSVADEVSSRAQKIAKSARDAANRYS